MSATKEVSQEFKYKFDLKDLTITAGSAVASYWIIDKFLYEMFPDDYKQFLAIGLVGASSITILGPIVENMIAGKNLMDGIDFDKDMLIDAAITLPTTYGLYYLIMKLFPEMTESTIRRYAGLIGSVIGSDMLLPYIRRIFF